MSRLLECEECGLAFKDDTNFDLDTIQCPRCGKLGPQVVMNLTKEKLLSELMDIVSKTYLHQRYGTQRVHTDDLAEAMTKIGFVMKGK